MVARPRPVRRLAIGGLLIALTLAITVPAEGIEDAPPPGMNMASEAEALTRSISAAAPRPDLPGAITSASGPGLFPAALARRLRSGGDPDASLGRVLLRAVLNVAGTERTAADPEDRYVILIPAGDLDADGVEDGLEYHVLDDRDTGEFDVSMAAVSGDTGDELWRHDSEAFHFAFPAGDLDGVAGDDVFGIEESGALPYWTVTFSGLRGATAEELWSRPYEATWAGASVGLLAGAFAFSDLAIPWRRVGDVDGDGRTDLLLGRFREAGGWAAVAADWVSQARFEFLSGATGAPISSFDAVGHGWLPDAWPVPDLTGDGLDDLVVVSIDWDWITEARVVLRAYSGRGGEHRWERIGLEPSPPWILGLELTPGSAASDILVQAWGWDVVTGDDYFVVRALSGDDGSDLWARRFSGVGFALAGGDRDGDGTEDLLGVSWEFADGITSTVFAVRGRDGEMGWSISAPEDWVVGLPGDLTGDGVSDVTLTAWDYDWNSGEFVVVGASEAVSGADGSVLWSRPPEDGFLIPARADLDGDAHTDVLAVRLRRAGHALTALSGTDGIPLWGPAELGGSLLWIDPARTPGGAALFESVETVTDDLTRARVGARGTEIWERRHA